jgi:hypothetical protein
MQVQHIGYRIRGFYRVAALGYLWDMTLNLGKSKLHVLLGPWCARHGIALPSVSTAVSSRPTSPASSKIKASSVGTPIPKIRR